MCPAATSSASPSGSFLPSSITVFKSEPSGFADNIRPALRFRKKSLADVGAPIGVEAIAVMKRFSSWRWLCGLSIRAIVVRFPEPSEVAAKVQFKVTPNAVADVAEFATARLSIRPRQHRKDHVVARLELGSRRPPEAVELDLRCGERLTIE
jgi:hypothetical protein